MSHFFFNNDKNKVHKVYNRDSRESTVLEPAWKAVPVICTLLLFSFLWSTAP